MGFPDILDPLIVQEAYATAMLASGLGAVLASTGGTDRMADDSYKAYNLVLSCEWMLIVARSRSHAWSDEGIGGLNINATGFIGLMMPDAGDTTTVERLRGVEGAALDALRSVCHLSAGG